MTDSWPPPFGVLPPDPIEPLAVRKTEPPQPLVERSEIPPALTMRKKLPLKRNGETQELTIAGTKMFVRTGHYADGTVGEVFFDIAKIGAEQRGLMGCLAIAISMGLQHGVSLEEFVEQFAHVRVGREGRVEGYEGLGFATGPISAAFRYLGMEYCGRVDLGAKGPPEEMGLTGMER